MEEGGLGGWVGAVSGGSCTGGQSRQCIVVNQVCGPLSHLCPLTVLQVTNLGNNAENRLSTVRVAGAGSVGWGVGVVVMASKDDDVSTGTRIAKPC